MNNTIEKSANQLYKESGTQLSIKEWIEREKQKGVHIPNVQANAEMMNLIGAEEPTKEQDKQKVLLRNIAVAATLLTLGFFVFRAIRNKTNE